MTRERLKEIEAAIAADTMVGCMVDRADLFAAVQRLRAALDVPYRPGLPSVEAVRAHQQRVPLGAWQIRYPDRPDAWPEWRQFFVIEAGQVTNGTRQETACVGMPAALLCGIVLPVADSGPLIECRPCTPDGTPCPWPESAP